MKEHLAWITEIYRFVFWPLIVLGFAFCREPNVRWTLLIFGLLNLSGTLLSQVIRPLGPVYGWVYHVAMGLLCLTAVKALVIFRPVISLWVGSALARIPLIGFLLAGLLPATYRAKLYPEELGLRRLCMVYVMTHSLVLLHYVMHWCGAMRPGGFIRTNRIV